MTTNGSPLSPRATASRWVWPLTLLGPVILLGPMLSRGEVLFWGTPLLQFYPWRTFALETLRGGHLPLWNPLVGMGAPLVANLQSALLYPPNWLLLLIDPAWGGGLLVLLHLLWTAAGMVLLARRLGVGPLGQTVAAQAWSMSTFLVSRSGFFSLNAAVAWLPWVLMLSVDLGKAVSTHPDPHPHPSPPPERGREGSSRVVLSLGVVLALQILAGHAQTTFYGLALAVALSLVAIAGPLRRAFMRWVGGWAIALALAFALAAAQLLPTIEYLVESSRAGGLDAEAALTYSFWPWRLLGLAAPGLFGSPATSDYWGYGNYWEDALYIGVVPLLLALTALLRSRASEAARRRITYLFGGAAVVALALALGANTPVYPLLYRWLPTFDLFNAPTRWNVVTTMALAVLAGFGADLWAPPSPRGRYWKHLAVAGSLAMAVVAFAAGYAALELQPSVSRAVTLLGLLLALATLLQLRWPLIVNPAWCGLVAVVVGADLVAANAGLLPATSNELYRASTSLSAAVGDGHRLYMPADLEYELKFERTHRFDTFDPGIDWLDVREAAMPNTPMIDGRLSANNFDPLLAVAYVEWIEVLEASMFEPELLALADIGWLARSTGNEPPWVEYTEVAGARRVRVVPEAEWVESRRAALNRLMEDEIDLDGVVLLEGPPEPSGTPKGGAGEASIVSDRDPGLVRVQAHAPQGGWLLLSDAWYPGWTAGVDGVTTHLYRADGLFRALRLSPGSHDVVFAYRPWSFAAGGALSALAWAAVLALWRKWRAA